MTNSKQGAIRGICALALLALMSLVSLSTCAAAATNQVLYLDGKDSFVALPPNIFNDLTEATVEGWVKWESLEQSTDFFDFGQDQQEMLVGVRGNKTLQFKINTPEATQTYRIDVPGLLSVNEWCHIAAVSGRGGMKLYFNGVLVGTHFFTGSFAATRSGLGNVLGKDFASDLGFFKGEMDEVRVWNVARTEEQIRDTMYRGLAGSEAGLVAYWNFDRVEKGMVQDLGPSAHHGWLRGQATIRGSQLPARQRTVAPGGVLSLGG